MSLGRHAVGDDVVDTPVETHDNAQHGPSSGHLPGSSLSVELVREGVQVLRVDRPNFAGDLIVHNNEICNSRFRVGGISLVDVSDPKRPVMLAEGVGDNTRDGVTRSRANQVHSSFAWDAGGRAYVILVEDEEALDVDIMEITDPRNPVMVKETGLPDWKGAQNAQSEGTGPFTAHLCNFRSPFLSS
ncbi:MAG: hypothetical protein ACRDHG_04775 [Anaerolineales bacterium]